MGLWAGARGRVQRLRCIAVSVVCLVGWQGSLKVGGGAGEGAAPPPQCKPSIAVSVNLQECKPSLHLARSIDSGELLDLLVCSQSAKKRRVGVWVIWLEAWFVGWQGSPAMQTKYRRVGQPQQCLLAKRTGEQT